jgi:Lrp/AsnC family transcriptional regulator for asnA, asnC and gidA
MTEKKQPSRAAKKGTEKQNPPGISFPRGNLQHLDDTNRQIIAMLQHDGRRSFSSIARDLGISEGAVRARVDYLQTHENLRFLAIIDPVEIGYMSWAVLGITVRPGILPSELAEYFKALPETIWVAVVAGRYDLIVEVWTETPTSLNQFLEEHCHKPGKITLAETMVGLRLHKWG